jgi:sec-independent protein translocase protein TatA
VAVRFDVFGYPSPIGEKVTVPSGAELLLILFVVLLLFGARKLPELARGVGESLRELRRGLDDDV